MDLSVFNGFSTDAHSTIIQAHQKSPQRSLLPLYSIKFRGILRRKVHACEKMWPGYLFLRNHI
jgi:hypothetical protein